MEQFFHELTLLLHDGPHWAFEIISDSVVTCFVFVLGAIIPDNLNPAKRWIARHDQEKHGQS